MIVVVDSRTGLPVAEFDDYLQAVVHRRDVLKGGVWEYRILGVPL